MSNRPLLVKLLYNHNPLYVVSAALVLRGVRLCYQPDGRIEEVWILVGILAAYLALLACTAVLIVRWAQVWEDARTILHTPALLLAAASCLFDEMQIQRPLAGACLLAGGFAFSLIFCELLIQQLRVRFPWPYRLALAALFGCFFGYPALLAQLVQTRHAAVVDWAVFSFTSAVGLCFAGLARPVARGRAYVEPTGTPWSWPWYPLCLFYFLAIIACLRAFLLTLSFEVQAPVRGLESAFGGYYLAPLVLSALFVQFEVANAAGLRWLKNLVAGVGAATPLLGLSIANNAASQRFLTEFVGVFGSPVFALCAATGLFLAYLWMRGAALAEFLFIGLVAVAAWIEPGDASLTFRSTPSSYCGYALALVLLITAIRRTSSLRSFLACAFLIVSLNADLHWTEASYFRLFAVFLTLACLAVAHGLAFRDRFARWLRDGGALALSGAAGAVLLHFDQHVVVPVMAREAYLTATAAFLLALWRWQGSMAQRLAMVVSVLELGSGFVGRAVQLLSQTFLKRGLPTFAASCVLLAAALLISFHKAGKLNGIFDRLSNRLQS